MTREEMIDRLDGGAWDIIVVGGGATGLGIAVDAQTRGYRTLLLEQWDFAKATSSRSTKLVHGGVRYLKQGNVSLVLEALRERGLLCRNAPHLVHDLAFVVPRYRWWEGPFYGIGFKLYDRLAGKLNIAPSRQLNRAETIARIPNVETENLIGGAMYHDAQFDDARLALVLARTAADHGAVLINYMPVTALTKQNGAVTGVVAVDQETGRSFELRARVVINATGIFADDVRRMDDGTAERMIAISQGVHLVLDRSFQPSDTAIMVPKTDDGRVLFVIPWHERVLVGTTDTPMEQPEIEPRALKQEIDFILRNAARYLAHDPSETDVLSVFAGLRPLFRSNGARLETKSVSREHTVMVSDSGLVTIIGGKWTTYRKMAQDTVDDAASVGALPERPCLTETLRLHGWMRRDDARLPAAGHMQMYGSDAAAVQAFIAEDAARAEPLHARLPYSAGQVLWAARHEMARTVDDILARRTRSLLLDARASIEAAPRVAQLLATELHRDRTWIESQVVEYTALARGYLP
ncbi:MAG TPA: glycerol-3-phosphate dehydrogenase/oxidase [Candidatus Margulisiibacteriota bacterium]|nr:glycerol-3-phosphate dehydrogenase/oxidase [Candidatus Margulisiibacteriota bacterium]